MKNVVYVWKPVGYTPLQLVEKFKKKYPEYKTKIVSYAGRLDPMAEGILVLLIGEENKNRNRYLGLDKIYETEIIFGVSTDTFDSLGLITEVSKNEVSKEEVERSLNKFFGKQMQLYPPYSSKTVHGKPLFWWTRNKKLDEIEIPKREIEIYSVELLEFKSVLVGKFVDELIEKIQKLEGDFRQKEIIESWNDFKNNYSDKELVKIKLIINCSSGTYIRRLADDLGKGLDTNAFAKSIKRLRVGEITEKQCIII